jgi:hypothetical protein
MPAFFKLFIGPAVFSHAAADDGSSQLAGLRDMSFDWTLKTTKA